MRLGIFLWFIGWLAFGFFYLILKSMIHYCSYELCGIYALAIMICIGFGAIRERGNK